MLRSQRVLRWKLCPIQRSIRGSGDELGDEDDEEEEDKKVEESSNFNSKSEDAEDEGSTTEDEDPGAGNAGLTAGDEGLGEPIGLGYGALRRQEIALGEGRMPSVFEVCQSSRFILESKRPKRVSALRQPTLTTWIDLEDGIAYIDVPAYLPPAPPVQTPPSPEWSSGLHPISPAPSIVPLPISSPMISLIVPLPIASPATAEGFLTDLGAQVEMQGGLIHDHIVRLGELSPPLFERYDRDIGELFTRSEGYAYPSICMIVWIGWLRLPSICVVIRADGYAYPVGIGKGLFDPKGGSCGGKGRRRGFMAGRGGGWLSKCSIVSNKGLGGGGFVVRGECLDGCDGAYGGEVKESGVNLGVIKSSSGEIPSETMGERCGDMMGFGGGPV
uniref:Uncharacterized protein n=1 Tax=Tanacetum cinerariifolium TaxID=118510 RepID=A0A6L2MJ38_TANCI|nr:hypothetical protein [Tanacetum cinerariifolium]